MPVDPAKLAALQKKSGAQSGGKGTPRRPGKKVAGRNISEDEKKLSATLKKFNAQEITGISEVNMFKEDGTVLHFPKVHVEGSVQANTFAISGPSSTKDIAELIPDILPQMGQDALLQLQQAAVQFSKLQEQAKKAAAAGGADAAKETGDDEIPNLVENFEDNVE
ncbi:Nascent polypeptide-associated complex subunit beta [Yarrowia sp. C11]|nr:Nascent polypeptide-associated complex subunit beta [Yarrowia sp. C11]KAG5364720.1 Nascent polypeptide-associated complex subunit beta [Yarrowia sp. E02]